MTTELNDQQLRQQAAAAIGLDLNAPFARQINGAVIADKWDPLTNIDDALDLAAKAQLTLSFGTGSLAVGKSSIQGSYSNVVTADTRGPLSITVCRSIVMAAVEIARSKAADRDKGLMS